MQIIDKNGRIVTEVMQILDEVGRILGKGENPRIRLGLAQLSQIVLTPSRVNIRLYANTEKSFLMLHCSGFCQIS